MATLCHALTVMSFNQTTYSVSENSGNITVNVFLIGGAVSGDEIVTVSTEAGGTATGGVMLKCTYLQTYHIQCIYIDHLCL